MHSKIIDLQTDIPIDVLKPINNSNKSWLKENLDFENKEKFRDLNIENKLFSNFFSTNQTVILNVLKWNQTLKLISIIKLLGLFEFESRIES